jgi:hypothetical protein
MLCWSLLRTAPFRLSRDWESELRRVTLEMHLSLRMNRNPPNKKGYISSSRSSTGPTAVFQGCNDEWNPHCDPHHIVLIATLQRDLSCYNPFEAFQAVRSRSHSLTYLASLQLRSYPHGGYPATHQLNRIAPGQAGAMQWSIPCDLGEAAMDPLHSEDSTVREFRPTP